jgi:polygalacturonase
VRAGSTLTRFDGSITAKAGQIIEDLDIYGVIGVNVANVVIRNCRIRGDNNNTPLIIAYGINCKNLLVEDCTIIPDNPLRGPFGYEGGDAITGHDFTIRRCNIQHTQDGIGVFNTNNRNGDMAVVIEQNYIDNLSFHSPDLTRSAADNKTHNDVIQIQGGHNIVVRGNNLRGFIDPSPAVSRMGSYAGTLREHWCNAVMQTTQGVGTVGEVVIENNWIDGGGISLNISGVYANFGRIWNNRFGTDHYYKSASGLPTGTILLNSQTVVDVRGNVYDATDEPILYNTNGG